MIIDSKILLFHIIFSPHIEDIYYSASASYVKQLGMKHGRLIGRTNLT